MSEKNQGVAVVDKDCKRLIKIAENHGWSRVKGSRGGHIQFTHPTIRGRVTIPHRNIKKNIIKSALKQIGVDCSVSDFRNGKVE